MSGTHPVKVIVFWLLLIALMVFNMPARAELDWVRVTTEYKPPKIDGHNMVYCIQDQVCLSYGWYNRDNAPMYIYDGDNWYQIPPSGDWPTPRSYFGMAYDASRDVVVVFGGFQGSADYLGDTWEWDGTEWEEKFPTHSPFDRNGHSMTYIDSLNLVCLFGGFMEDSTPSDEFYTWDGFDWSLISAGSGPSPRAGTPLIYDSHRDRVVLFGGTENGGTPLNDTWEWDGVNWMEISPSTSPDGKYLHQMVYDPNRQVTVMFGGADVSMGISNETWEYNGSDWAQISPGHHPSARGKSAACFDSFRQRVVLYGGYTWSGSNDETWEYYDVPTPTPSPTPTITPSPTITPTPVPTCTPTATPIDGVLLALHLPEEPIHAGDTFYLDVNIHNANPDPLTDIPLFVILEAAGTFWYHPSWSMEPAWETLSIIPTGTMGVTILEAFEWPDNAGNGTARFWGAVTDAEMTRVLGNYDVKDFCWE